MPGDPEALERLLVATLGIGPQRRDDQEIHAYRVLLQLCWERMEPVVGQLGAQAILGHAVKAASKKHPRLSPLSSGDRGIDISGWLATDAPSDRQEVARELRALCVAVFGTLVELTGDVLAAPILGEMRLSSGTGGEG